MNDKPRDRFFVVRAILDEQTGQYLHFHTSDVSIVQEITDKFNADPAFARDWGWIPKRPRWRRDP